MTLEELLPCDGRCPLDEINPTHYEDCPAHYRPDVAAALEAARREGAAEQAENDVLIVAQTCHARESLGLVGMTVVEAGDDAIRTIRQASAEKKP